MGKKFKRNNMSKSINQLSVTVLFLLNPINSVVEITTLRFANSSSIMSCAGVWTGTWLRAAATATATNIVQQKEIERQL